MIRVPDFLGIGTQRSGSTWLHQHLQRHPGIWLPPVKSVHYFDRIDPSVGTREYRYSHDIYSRLKHYTSWAILKTLRKNLFDFEPHVELAWDWLYFSGKPSIDWYTKLFASAKQRGFIVGEITPAYCMLSSSSIQEIKKINPLIKVVLVMRDPIDRAWSQIQKDIGNRESPLYRATDPRRIVDFIHSDDSIGYSDYEEIIDRWQPIIGRDNLLIGYFDHMKQEPTEFLKNVVEFIGAPWPGAIFGEELSKTVNSAQSHSRRIPEQIERALAELYEPKLRSLAARCGPPVQRWHDRAALILGRRPQ